jgi:hypothetical protein
MMMMMMLKRLGREADHSLLSVAEVNNAWNYTSTPLYVFMAWRLINHRIRLHGVILKHRDCFTFILNYGVKYCCTPETV